MSEKKFVKSAKNEISKNPIVERELAILKFWQENKIFEKTLAATKNGKPYSFYDGPPFATGAPHYGHLVAGLMKDVVPRYRTMKGNYVERRWGWDCHGLPIENIVEKDLGLKSKKEIEEMGIDKFNERCRARVLDYVENWQKTIGRFGRWADMEDSYKTMDLDYMESVWWVFKQLWDKSLIYEGDKSMHVCPRCETTLSQQEVSEGYKDIKDWSVTAKFELVDEPGTYILAWTTTPWTLPGNVALAVGEDIKYLLVQAANGIYIVASDSVGKIFTAETVKVLKKFTGKDLIGKKYKSLFSYYLNKDLPNKEQLYTVVSADFVTTEDGTGVVHIAPAFGEEDMQLGQEKNLPFIQNVTMSGHFKDEVEDFKGMNVKPVDDPRKTDVEIIKYLDKNNLLFAKEKYEHSYPHCWRCETPLINYATSSWFVKVSAIKKRASALAKKINWSPAHIKEGRFGNWLEGARDWSISRQRFWASCIPIWQCECGELKVFGSIKELEKVSGAKITDLHKHYIDKIEVPCPKCGKKMKRIPDVIDCWFESGSMPYAQEHYPFENKDKFEKKFPAQFIAEGVDQTRAWFYYLHLIATAIKNKIAYENVIVNGIVLAEDGKKMAKRLQNYPEPDLVMDKYGADAMRYYLLSSPVMASENLDFSEAGVKEAMQKVVMLLNNILNFYKLYEDLPSLNLSLRRGEKGSVLDKWLLAKLNLLIKEVTAQMEAYDLVRSVRPIAEFIDEFSTWWLRRSRDRFKEEGDDKNEALAVFRFVLLELSKVMAPFTPFIAEYLYREVGGEKESVHLDKWPKAIEKLIDNKILEPMAQVRKIVEIGLAARAENNLKIRQPLALLKVYSYQLPDEFGKLIADEVNVKEVKFMKGVELKVEIDTNITEDLKIEGAVRELIRSINDRRKKQGLTISDKIKVLWQSDGEVIKKIFADQKIINELKKNTITIEFLNRDNAGNEMKINKEKVILQIEKV